MRAAVHGENPAAVEPDHPFLKDPLSWKDNAGLQEMFFTGVPVVCDDIDTDPRMSAYAARLFPFEGNQEVSDDSNFGRWSR